MITRYYPAETILKHAICDNCGAILRYVRSDFGRGKLAWLHTCDKCGKSYWLDNRFPCADYIANTSRPLDIRTDPIESEEAK